MSCGWWATSEESFCCFFCLDLLIVFDHVNLLKLLECILWTSDVDSIYSIQQQQWCHYDLKWKSIFVHITRKVFLKDIFSRNSILWNWLLLRKSSGSSLDYCPKKNLLSVCLVHKGKAKQAKVWCWLFTMHCGFHI